MTGSIRAISEFANPLVHGLHVLHSGDHGPIVYRATLESAGLQAVNALLRHLADQGLVTVARGPDYALVIPTDINGNSLADCVGLAIPTAAAFGRVRDLLHFTVTDGGLCDCDRFR